MEYNTYSEQRLLTEPKNFRSPMNFERAEKNVKRASTTDEARRRCIQTDAQSSTTISVKFALGWKKKLLVYTPLTLFASDVSGPWTIGAAFLALLRWLDKIAPRNETLSCSRPANDVRHATFCKIQHSEIDNSGRRVETSNGAQIAANRVRLTPVEKPDTMCHDLIFQTNACYLFGWLLFIMKTT